MMAALASPVHAQTASDILVCDGAERNELLAPLRCALPSIEYSWDEGQCAVANLVAAGATSDCTGVKCPVPEFIDGQAVADPSSRWSFIFVVTGARSESHIETEWRQVFAGRSPGRGRATSYKAFRRLAETPGLNGLVLLFCPRLGRVVAARRIHEATPADLGEVFAQLLDEARGVSPPAARFDPMAAKRREDSARARAADLEEARREVAAHMNTEHELPQVRPSLLPRPRSHDEIHAYIESLMDPPHK